METYKFNEFRWDCNEDGCFNKKRRLKFGRFFNALPKRISFSDLDGIVECFGNALILEWKYYDEDSTPSVSCIPRGQQIMFERLAKAGNISIICVAGNAEDMSVKYIKKYHGDNVTEWIPGNQDNLLKSISSWVAWSENNSKIKER
jgi:hypothetical protein